MRNKNSLFTAFILMVSFLVTAQEMELSVTASQELRTRVIEKSKITTSIISDFEQYKHLDFLSDDIRSSGKLTFKSPSSIKWEYKVPFIYSAVFKNNKLYINDDGVKSKINLDANKTFKSLNNLIIKSVRGDMFDDEKFEISYFENSETYIVHFKSVDKALKKLISEFVLTFDKESLNVIEVKMIESTNDFTLLKFLNQQTNQTVSDAVFTN
jgi:outer membrane lipoprotein carrier protein